MRIIDRHQSPDGQLTIAVVEGDAGDVAVGFEGGEWHTHPDLLSLLLGVPEEAAVGRFIELVKADALPIVVSTDGGQTIDPWVPDDLAETVRVFGEANCVLRYWSSREAVK